MKPLTEAQKEIFEQFERLAVVEGSQNKACQKVGVGSAIISGIRSGNYAGDAEKYIQKLKDYFTVKTEGEESYLNGGYVETSISKKVYGYIRNAQIKGGLIALSGDAGIGKTQAIRKYTHDHPHDSIWITANPCLNSVKPVLKALCRALNVIARTNDDMYIGILDKLRDGMVLIFDESQHLHLKTIEVLRGFSDYFADNGMTLGIIFIGNVETINKFGGKQEAVFHQISNRTKQKPVLRATDILREDMQLLFPDTKEPDAVDFLWGVAQSAQAMRGATNLYSNAFDNGDTSYKGLVAMAKHMEMRL